MMEETEDLITERASRDEREDNCGPEDDAPWAADLMDRDEDDYAFW